MDNVLEITADVRRTIYEKNIMLATFLDVSSA